MDGAHRQTDSWTGFTGRGLTSEINDNFKMEVVEVAVLIIKPWTIIELVTHMVEGGTYFIRLNEIHSLYEECLKDFGQISIKTRLQGNFWHILYTKVFRNN